MWVAGPTPVKNSTNEDAIMNRVVISFEMNGHGEAITTIDCPYTVPGDGDGVQLDSYPTPEAEGYIFAGWYLSPDFDEEKKAWDYLKYKEDTVLYAKWEAEPEIAE